MKAMTVSTVMVALVALMAAAPAALATANIGAAASATAGNAMDVFDLIIVIGVIVGLALVVFGFFTMMRNKNEGGDAGKSWKWVMIGSVVATPTIVMGLINGTFFGIDGGAIGDNPGTTAPGLF